MTDLTECGAANKTNSARNPIMKTKLKNTKNTIELYPKEKVVLSVVYIFIIYNIRIRVNKYGSVQELRSTFRHLKSFKILG